MATPAVPGADVYTLEQGGVVARVLAGEAHESGLRTLWDRWRAQLEAGDGPAPGDGRGGGRGDGRGRRRRTILVTDPARTRPA